jgi:hypothetical protein
MHTVDESVLDLFMAFKLATPSADDNTAALLTLASVIARHPSF